MTHLGIFTAGEPVFYAGNFHDPSGALADPSNPAAELRSPSGAWSALAAPTKQNAKTGHFGGTISTAGLSPGQYVVRLTGTVGTSGAGAEFFFTVGPVAANAAEVGGIAVSGPDDLKFRPSVEVLDHNGTRSFTYKEAMRLIFSFLVGERSGGGYSGDKSFKVPGGQKTRVTMRTDAGGNSTASHTLDAGDV